MSKTISFKVPKEIKAEFDRLKSEVDWAEELRQYVIKRVKSIKKERVLKKIVEELIELGPANVPEGFSMRSVREDRDSC
ncbi:CopG family transcriptional regulator [Candidatus Bathyarchaeota archaeon]|nr:CopG family transcriptional regulator [Candidatus Bathyarchaeota archaeon]